MFMYKGFNLKYISAYKRENQENFEEYYDIGERLARRIKKRIKKSFESFLYDDKEVIDGTKLIEEWFPLIKTEVFISHSHKDEELAIFLSGFLYYEYGISCFIDSVLWGYSLDLLKDLNNKYSKFPDNPHLYDYNKAIYATNHVDMMLSSSLATMIDKSECFILINTPKTVDSYEELDKTESPWIYSEILFSKLLKGKKPERDIELIMESVKNYHSLGAPEPDLKIDYTVDLNHLKKTTFTTMVNAMNKSNNISRQYRDYKKYMALDELYKLDK